MITKTFSRVRETKNTCRFQEDGLVADYAVGPLYVRKEALAKLGNPVVLAMVLGTPEEFADDRP